MICFNMSLCIVAAFLVLTLVVGIYFSRKETTFREYAIGNKQFATATLVATVLATWYSGSQLVFNVECVHEHGLLWVVTFLDCFGLLMISKLALRMGPFMQHLSMAETMGYIYGKYARVISALAGISGCIVTVTMQITVISQAIGMCVTLTNPYVIPILATLLLIFYSTFGGVRAVTFTDVLQFGTFSIIIPLLSWFLFTRIDKPIAEIIPVLQSQAKFQFSSLSQFNTHLVGIFFLVLSSLGSYIDPQIIQRVYMTSSPIQAQKVFSYATIFNFIIGFFIILVGLLVASGAPDLQTAEIWPYIVAHVPSFFKGFLSISLLAMAMSTADSYLNACAVMVSHDIVQILHKGKAIDDDTSQLKIARRTTLVVGVLAMLLAFKCKNLLQLLYWTFDFQGPILTAPFMLAVFGFRGTARTAFIGMIVGVLTILAWNKWIEPLTEMNGAFVAMLANGLAMLAAHYLLKQPKGTGWVKPDNTFQQIQQANARKRAERQETIKNLWGNRAASLTRLVPNHATMVYMGCYGTITSLLAYFIVCTHHKSWLIFHLFGSACCLGYPFLYDIFKKIQSIPKWGIGLAWLIGLALYLPFNLLWHWWNLVDPIFSVSLSLAHCAVILWLLPLYLGIGVVVATLLIAIYPISVGLTLPLFCSLLPLFVVSLLLFSSIICLRVKLDCYKTKIFYLENQVKIRKSRKLKASLYESAMVSVTTVNQAKGYGTILTQAIGKIEQSISFLDSNLPLYKEDIQSIINKLYDWVYYFNRSERAKKHALLHPTKITVDKLMRKVELALSQESADPPRLLIEKVGDPSRGAPPHIVCDIHQVVYLLVQAVLRVGKLEGSAAPVVRIQLHPTALQFRAADPIDGNDPTYLLFQATALVVSQVTTSLASLPKVKDIYQNRIDEMGPQESKETPPSIDLQQETISSIVVAHCGHLAYPVDHRMQQAMLLVLPNDVTDILGRMTAKLPIDGVTLEAPVTPKEEADSMMALMQFHDYVCKSSLKEDPIDIGTISGLLLLLRKHFAFKRHLSGQLFYVRAVGIAAIVVEWVFHSPKVIYAALLYGLVRHTCLPLSYVKAHYNLGVYAFVLNVVGIDKRQALDHPSLLYVQNRLKEAIKEGHVQLSVLFIKLAERLYDLRHAAGYLHLTEVQHMAQETLAIDVKLAHTYLGPEIGEALEQAATQALEICKNGIKNKKKRYIAYEAPLPKNFVKLIEKWGKYITASRRHVAEANRSDQTSFSFF